MEVIWKYELVVADVNTIAMPYGNRILNVKVQDDRIVIYALVDNSEIRMVDRTFVIYGTGEDAPQAPHMEYLDTVLMAGGKLVWHVFYARCSWEGN